MSLAKLGVKTDYELIRIHSFQYGLQQHQFVCKLFLFVSFAMKYLTVQHGETNGFSLCARCFGYNWTHAESSDLALQLTLTLPCPLLVE